MLGDLELSEGQKEKAIMRYDRAINSGGLDTEPKALCSAYTKKAEAWNKSGAIYDRNIALKAEEAARIATMLDGTRRDAWMQLCLSLIAQVTFVLPL